MRRFWMITNPDAIAELKKIDRKRKAAKKSLYWFGEKISAIETGEAEGLFQTVTSVGFKFSKPPDPKFWKQIEGAWWVPKASAKDLKKKCQELADAYPSSEPVAEMIGVDCWIDTKRFCLCTPKFVQHKRNWYFSTTDPKFNGNEHVERLSDIEMERLFGK